MSKLKGLLRIFISLIKILGAFAGLLIALSAILLFLEYKGLKTWIPNIYVFGSHVSVWLAIIFINKAAFSFNKKPSNLYEWLNNPILKKEDDFFSGLKKEKINDLMWNLEKISKAILVYTDFNINKLRLLRSYIKTRDTEGTRETLIRTIFTLLSGPIFLIVIKSPKILDFIKVEQTGANETVMDVTTIITVFIIFVFFLNAIITDLFYSKKKNKLLVEIIDANIESFKKHNQS
ncbi:hypothetical protein M3687_09305 [Bacillus subtilis]|uniref:hypothetical protein n=1 Tax=Bacillus subtilis TaxID=1423 RepID=UPI0020417301|nr:hypothetical protein [Bacillus subtilis]MCM3525261.1 hypothetical protein [Bacillus subtilis]